MIHQKKNDIRKAIKDDLKNDHILMNKSQQFMELIFDNTVMEE